MRIIETCPKCYGDLKTFILKSDLYLWRPKKVCESCGWEWIGDAESEVARIPFDETNYNRRAQHYVEEYNPVWIERYVPMQPTDAAYDSSSCKYCSNNPRNGGSGVCHCILGAPEIR